MNKRRISPPVYIRSTNVDKFIRLPDANLAHCPAVPAAAP